MTSHSLSRTPSACLLALSIAVLLFATGCTADTTGNDKTMDDTYDTPSRSAMIQSGTGSPTNTGSALDTGSGLMLAP